MNPSQQILQFLVDMTTTILHIGGVASMPLIVLIIFRVGRLRGLNNVNAAERLGDLCFDTIKERIRDQIGELLQIYNFAPFPSAQRIQDAAAFLHQDSESLEQLLPILNNLTELGLNSPEFQQILFFLAQP